MTTNDGARTTDIRDDARAGRDNLPRRARPASIARSTPGRDPRDLTAAASRRRRRVPGGAADPDAAADTAAANAFRVKTEEAEEDASVGRANDRLQPRRQTPRAARGRAKPAEKDAAVDWGKALFGGDGANPGYTPAGVAALAREKIAEAVGAGDVSKPAACQPRDCAGHWGPWSACDSPCFRGTATRRWTVTRQGSCGGTPCVHNDGEVEERACEGQGTNCCPGEWGFWTPCTEACGGGVRGRTFEVDIDNAPGECEVPKAQEEACNVAPCVVDCAGEWSDWENCDAVCGVGKQTRTFEVTRRPEGGGKECEAASGGCRPDPRRLT